MESSLANRQMMSQSFSNSNRTVKILTMNTLADQCAKNDPQGFPYVDYEILEWNNRKVQLIKIITEQSPDFICLQEVDHFTDWFEPELLSLGYTGIFCSNGGVSALDKNLPKHGCCLFYKSGIYSNVFYSKNILGVEYPTVFICGLFENIITRKNIVIGTTHLKAKSPFRNARLDQGKYILENIKGYLTDTSTPIIIAGDFNATPDEPVCDYFRKFFTSAYDDVEKSDDFYTTIKQRDILYKRCIDYIWYIPVSVTLTKRLGVVRSDDVPYPYLPNLTHPSDHLHIIAEFRM